MRSAALLIVALLLVLARDAGADEAGQGADSVLDGVFLDAGYEYVASVEAPGGFFQSVLDEFDVLGLPGSGVMLAAVVANEPALWLARVEGDAGEVHERLVGLPFTPDGLGLCRVGDYVAAVVGENRGSAAHVFVFDPASFEAVAEYSIRLSVISDVDVVRCRGRFAFIGGDGGVVIAALATEGYRTVFEGSLGGASAWSFAWIDLGGFAGDVPVVVTRSGELYLVRLDLGELEQDAVMRGFETPNVGGAVEGSLLAERGFWVVPGSYEGKRSLLLLGPGVGGVVVTEYTGRWLYALGVGKYIVAGGDGVLAVVDASRLSLVAGETPSFYVERVMDARFYSVEGVAAAAGGGGAAAVLLGGSIRVYRFSGEAPGGSGVAGADVDAAGRGSGEAQAVAVTATGPRPDFQPTSSSMPGAGQVEAVATTVTLTETLWETRTVTVGGRGGGGLDPYALLAVLGALSAVLIVSAALAQRRWG